MKIKSILGVLLVLVIAVSSPSWATISPTILQNLSTADGVGNTLSVGSYNSGYTEITISGTARISPQGQGATGGYRPVTCINVETFVRLSIIDATGNYQCPLAGLTNFQAPVSNCAACTVNVQVTGSSGVISVPIADVALSLATGVAGASSNGLQDTFAFGKSITGANSRANAFRWGDGVTQGCNYTDATLGSMSRPCVDSNILTIIANTFTWSVWDEANALAMEVLKPSGASPSLMYTYPNTTYRPKKQIWLSAGALYGDGVQCPAAPSTVTINSGAPRSTFICANNNASSLYGEAEMPDSWDGDTVTITPVFIQTAADTAKLDSHVAAACRVNADTINNTWGTSQTTNIASMGGSNKINTITSAAVTPNGTCTGAGTMLQVRWQIDNTTVTAMATLHFLGFKVTYSEKSRSS